MSDFRITLSEFVKQVVKEMEENNWQGKPLAFNTANRLGLHWLSISEIDGVINVDIGTGDE